MCLLDFQLYSKFHCSKNFFTQMKDGFDAGKKIVYSLYQRSKLKQQISSLQLHSKWLIPQNSLSNAGRPLWSVIAKSKKLQSFSDPKIFKIKTNSWKYVCRKARCDGSVVDSIAISFVDAMLVLQLDSTTHYSFEIWYDWISFDSRHKKVDKFQLFNIFSEYSVNIT